MSVVRERIFSRLYRDSVELMAIASTLERAEGVERVGAVMATPANLAILQASGMLPAGLIAAPDDLVIVVRAQDEDAATVTLEEAEQHLAGGDVPGSQPSGTVLHTIADAMTQKLPPPWPRSPFQVSSLPSSESRHCGQVSTCSASPTMSPSKTRSA